MKSVLEYLEHSAEVYPEKLAFADEQDACSFAQLRAQARIIGSRLAAYGIVRKPVPVMMEKSVQTIKILMGIVYAGGFYVMLDASHPVNRLKQILEMLDADLMIVSLENQETAGQLGFSGTILLPEEAGLQKDDLGSMVSAASDGRDEAADDALTGKSDLLEQIQAGQCGIDPLEQIQADQCDIDPLYVLFTSGSTGVPKGVVVSHRSVIDFMECFADTFGITQEDVLGNQAPWDFDVSVKDIYTGLKTGAAVQIIPRRMFSIPMQLLDFLDERKVTNLTWAVSALCIVSTLNGFSYKVPSSLKRVMFSGETMPIRHLNYWRSYLPDAMFVNLYGPTEITCNCTYYILDRAFEPGDVLPIGTAFANEKVFLLDESNQEIKEIGVKGEICVSGTALALGYYKNPEQTQKVFVQNPLNPWYTEMIYRTGDLGVYNEEGLLCFASRKDFQIKHMGHRIELGEIECALEKVEGLVRSTCFFDEKKNKIVCCYQGETDKKKISAELRAFLPDYMIPNVFRRTGQMPITKNGKIDKKVLRALYEEKKLLNG